MTDKTTNLNPSAKEPDFSHKVRRNNSTFFVILKQFSRNKLALAGLILILIFALMGIFAEYIAPYDFAAIDPVNANKAPSAEHWFGTDSYGRDVFSRIIYGARNSLSIGVGASLFGVIVGLLLGSIAGYFGGAIESLILRCCDIIQSIPNMLLCIVVSQVLGRGFIPTIIALSFYSIPETVRILRSSMLSLKEQEFIEAERAINCSNLRILVCHILPNCMAPIIISFSIGIGMKIMNSAGLSYLGLGIQEPTAEWGAMISLGKNLMRYAPHNVLFPGLFVALVVLAFNVVGDGLRDALDPKLRK